MEDFRARIGVEAVTDAKKIQSQIDNKVKNVKINADLNVDTTKSKQEMYKQQKEYVSFWETAIQQREIKEKQSDINISKAKESFNKKNLSAYDMEIKKAEETSRINSNILKSQTQERIAAESKIQADLKKTAKVTQDSFNLNIGKDQLRDNVSSYLKNNSKLSVDLKNKLTDVQSKIKDVDGVGLNNLKKQFSAIKSEANALGQTGDSTFTKLNKNVKQFLSFLSAGTIVMSGVNAVRSMITEVTNLDKAFISLRKVTDETDATYRRFLQTAIENSKVLGGSVSDMVEMTATWAKLGYTINEATELAKTSTIFANVADIKDTDTAVGDLVTSMKAYKIQASDSISIADKFNELGNKYATDAASLGEGLSNAASSLALAGNDINESLALITGGTEITQNASEMGNAVKVLSMRLRGMKGELEDIGEEFESVLPVSKIQTQIYNLTQGTVNIMDDLDPTKFKSTYEIMKQISDVWSKLSEVDQSQLLEIIAGKQRGNSIAALIQSFQSGQAQNALQDSINSVGSALKEQQKYMEGIQYSADRLKASFQELSSDTINSSWVKGFLDLSNVLVNVVDKVGLFSISMVALSAVLGSKTSLGMNIIGTSIDALITKMGIASGVATTLSTTLGVLIPIAAIAGGIAIFNKLNVTLDDVRENTAKLQSEYDSLQTDLTTANTELETTVKRIDDLNSKDNLTFIEKSELDNLKDTNKQLETQISLLQKQSDLKNQELNTSIKNEFDKQYGSNSNVQKNISEAGTPWYDKSVFVGTQESYVDYQLKRYTELNEIKQKGVDLTKDEQKEYEKIAESLTNAGVDYADFASRYKLDDDIKQSWVDMADLINKTLDPNKWKDSQFNDFLSQEGSTSIIDSLKELAKSGELTTETLSSTKEYKSILDETALSAQDVVDQINALVSSISSSEGGNNAITNTAMTTEEALKKANEAIDNFQASMKTIKEALSDTSSLSSSDLIDLMQEFSDFNWKSYGVTGEKGIGDLTGALKGLAKQQYDIVKASGGTSDAFNSLYQDTIKLADSVSDLSSTIASLDNISNSLSSLDSAYSSLIEKQSVSIGDIKSLSNAFGNVSGFQDFINTISSATSVTEDVQSAFNDLVTSYLNGSDILNDLDDSTKDLVITQLNHIGVTNSEEIVTKKLAQQKLILAETGLDVKNATAEEIVELLNETKVSDETRVALLNLANQKLGVNNIALSTSGDIQNLLSLMSIANATSDALTALAAIKAGDVGAGRPGDMDSLLASAQAEIDAYYKSLTTTQTNVSYSGGSKTKSTLDKAKKKDNTKKESKFSNQIDWAKTSVDKLNSAVSNFEKTMDDSKPYASQIADLTTLISLQNKLATGYTNQAKTYKSEFSDVTKGLDDKYINKIKNGGTFTIQDFAGKSEGEQEKLYNQITKAQSVYDQWQDALTNAKNTTLDIADNTKKIAEIKLTEQFEKVDNSLKSIDNTISNIDLASSLVDENSIAQITLLQSGLSEATKKSTELNKAISDLNKQYKNNKEDETYKNRLGDLTSQLIDAASKMKSYQQSIANAMKARYEEQTELEEKAFKKEQDDAEKIHDSKIEAYKAELDAFKKIVDAQKEANDEDEKALQYKKKITEKVGDINKIQARILELEKAANSGDREATAEKKKLEEDLAKAQTDLQDTQHDYEVDSKQDAIDKAYDSYEDLINGQIDLENKAFDLAKQNAQTEYDTKLANMESLYKNQEQLIKDAAALTISQFSEAFDTINSTLSSYGLSMSSGLSDSLSSSNKGLGSVGSGINLGANAATTSPIKQLLKNGTGVKGDSDLNKYVKANYGSYLTYAEMAKVGNMLGVSGINGAEDMSSGTNRNKILLALKKAGFSSGGTVNALGSLIKSTGEDGIALVKHGESILTVEQGKLFKEFISNLQPLNNLVKLTTPDLSSVVTNNNSSPTIQINLPASTTIDNSAINNYRKLIPELANAVSDQLMNTSRQYR